MKHDQHIRRYKPVFQSAGICSSSTADKRNNSGVLHIIVSHPGHSFTLFSILSLSLRWYLTFNLTATQQGLCCINSKFSMNLVRVFMIVKPFILPKVDCFDHLIIISLLCPLLKIISLGYQLCLSHKLASSGPYIFFIVHQCRGNVQLVIQPTTSFVCRHVGTQNEEM